MNSLNTASPDKAPGVIKLRLLHTMLRVRDLDRALAFYSGPLGMTLFRKETFPEGRFTLAFVGYGREETNTAIELTYNWDISEYQSGTDFGHIALSVEDVAAACAALAAQGVKILRAAGPMTFMAKERADWEIIAFIEDPDGYCIELIEMPRGERDTSVCVVGPPVT